MPEGALPKGGWLIGFCLGFIAGIACYPIIKADLLVFGFSLFISLSFIIILAYVKHRLFLLLKILFLSLGFILGCLRYELNIHQTTANDLDFYLNQKVEISGQVISEPSTKNNETEFDVRANNFISGQSVSGQVRLRTNLFPEFKYGDQVKVKCKLQAPTNTTFNYQRYLARYHIYVLCFNAKVTKLDQPNKNLVASLINFKLAIINLIKTNVGEPEASLIGPVIFGGGDNVDDDITNMFRRVGLTHIMAVSGFNVSILALGLAYILFLIGLSRKQVFYFSSLGVVLYIIMVSWPASAVRAGIMSIILLYSLVIGRPIKIINLIIMTAAGTLIFNPLYLAADLGWQLSFLALLGLIYLQPPLAKLFSVMFIKKLKWLSDTLSATLAAQIATIPISLYNFGQVSLIAPVANILVVGLIPIFTLVSIVALPLAYVMPMVGRLVFLPSFFMAKYIMLVVKILASLPWASLNIDR